MSPGQTQLDWGRVVALRRPAPRAAAQWFGAHAMTDHGIRSGPGQAGVVAARQPYLM